MQDCSKLAVAFCVATHEYVRDGSDNDLASRSDDKYIMVD